MIFVSAVCLAVFAGLQVWVQQRQYLHSGQEIRKRVEGKAREQIRSQTSNVVRYVEMRRKNHIDRIKTDMRERVDQAAATVVNIKTVYGPDQDMLRKQAVTALRPIRFFDGRGYYFIFHADGTMILNAADPGAEGHNMFLEGESYRGIVSQQLIRFALGNGEGYQEYEWPVPGGAKDALVRKISYVKYIPEMNWIVGAGEYPPIADLKLQQQVLDHISVIRFSNDDYVFAGQWDGLSLTSPAKGKNMYDVTDKNGVKIVQELIKAARAGGGYVRYVMPGIDGRKHQPKIAYAEAIPDWQWYVGAGIYLDDLQNQLDVEKAELARENRRQLILFGSALGLALLIAGGAAMMIARNMNRGMDVFNAFFEQAADLRDPTDIDTDRLRFQELKDLAEAANVMLLHRRTASQRIEDSERRYRTLADNLPIGVFRAEPGRKGRFLMANRALAEMCAAGAVDDLMTISALDLFVNPMDPARILALLGGQGHIENFETNMKRLDGTRFPAAITITAMRGADGSVEHFDGLVQDITERLLAEQSLRESEERYRNLSNLTIEGIVIHHQGRVLEVNQSLCDMTGYAKEELIGMDGLGMGGPELREEMEHLVFTERDAPVQIKLPCKNGEFLEVEVEYRNLVYQNLDCRVTAVRDISERLKIEKEKEQLHEQLVQSQKMEAVGLLAGGVAHDFNNMLGVILGHVQLMLADLGADDPEREDLEAIRTAAERSRDITRKLLAFSRKEKPHLRPVPVRRIVDELMILLKHTVPPDIRIQNDVQGSPVVNVDTSQLQQALLNICLNARDAMPKGGTLSIVCAEAEQDSECFNFLFPSTAPAGYCCFQIADTGGGIPETHLDRLFEPFYTTKESGRGTGLGLSVTHGIIVGHEGRIALRNRKDVQGAEAIIAIPLARECDACGHAPEDVQAHGHMDATILVVDDEEPLLKILQKGLEREGFSVIAAPGGKAAMDLIQDPGQHIDLMILDMIMPDHSGEDVFSVAKASRPELPVLVATGYADEHIERSLLKSGARGLLRKPFDIAELVTFVRAIIRTDSSKV